MIYIVFAVLFLHIISVPISVEIKIYVDSDENLGYFVAKILFFTVIRKKIHIEKIKRLVSFDLERHDNSAQENSNGKAIDNIFFSRLLSRICVRSAKVSSRIGTGDAAIDGMAVGALRIMCSQICAYFMFGGAEAEIEPAYGTEIVFFDANGIFTVCIADIIYAACCVVFSVAQADKRRVYANVAE